MERLVEARAGAELDAARRLFLEYRDTPGVAECVTGFQQEVDSLPGRYFVLLVALDDQDALGCVAVRELDPQTCEMKRLFVRPEARGRHLSRRLAEEAIRHAVAAGYARMRLDSLPSMTAAIALYRSLGFHEIPRYYDAAPPLALFFEIDLNPPNR